MRTGLGGDWVRRYRYSPEGDLRAASDSLGGETTYRYDAAHRVSGVQRPDAPFEPIDHDIGNNVLRMPGLSGVRLLDGNRLQSANGETIEYDKRNHLAVRRVGTVETRYHYDERDLLMKVEKTEQPDWTATYDPFGRRVRKQWGVGKWVEYFWDTDRLIAERNETGRVRVYVYADPSALMPMLFVEYPDAETDTAAGKRYYVFADQIGTPTRVEDDAGAVAWSARIDPYGRTTVDPGNRIDFDFRFPGHWFDAETGLHSNRYRSYDPALGRYLQSDPLGVAGGMNLYAYCGGNPLVRVDVKGLADDLTDKQRDVYNDLRGSTPSDKNRADCNKGGSTCALTGETPPAKPGGEKGVLAADHVVPFKEIVKLKGFTELTREQQLAIANNPENFQPLLKGVNSSKGGKEVEDWKTLRGEDITTGKEGKARAAMLEKAEESKKALLAQIKQFEKEKEEAKQKNKKPCKK